MRNLVLSVLAAVAALAVLAAVPAAAAVQPARHYWTRVPSALAPRPAGTHLPRGDAFCAARVQLVPERIPANRAANHTPGPRNPAALPWGPWATTQGGLWNGYLNRVTGHFTGTTDEILEWAACKWGLDQNWLKAQGVSESSWVQSEIGDSGASVGILEVKATQELPGDFPHNNDAWGGWPWTHNSTAVDADFLAAYLRATFDGTRGTNFYGGALTDIARAHGWDYVMWDAVGSWYSGDWGDAQDYVSGVQGHLAGQDWRHF